MSFHYQEVLIMKLKRRSNSMKSVAVSLSLEVSSFFLSSPRLILINERCLFFYSVTFIHSQSSSGEKFGHVYGGLIPSKHFTDSRKITRNQDGSWDLGSPALKF